MRRSRVQGLTNLGSISEIFFYVGISNQAKFHAFITKVNNSVIFWTITSVLGRLRSLEVKSCRAEVGVSLRCSREIQVVRDFQH